MFAGMKQGANSKLQAPSSPRQVRAASDGDVRGIGRLVNVFARRGDLLPRSAESIAAGLHNWFVAEDKGQIVGCVSLLRYTSGLVEVRSLAVDDAVQGRGIGRLLMDALIEEAKRREIPTLFALTRAVGFFERCGFMVVSKGLFPEKVWADCQYCPVRERCDETAVMLEL
jgi:amino-acid N-acetyltransferase